MVRILLHDLCPYLVDALEVMISSYRQACFVLFQALMFHSAWFLKTGAQMVIHCFAVHWMEQWHLSTLRPKNLAKKFQTQRWRSSRRAAMEMSVLARYILLYL